MQIATFPIKVNDALQTALAFTHFEASIDKGELRKGTQHTVSHANPVSSETWQKQQCLMS